MFVPSNRLRATAVVTALAVLAALAPVTPRAESPGLADAGHPTPVDREKVVAGRALPVRSRPARTPAPQPSVTWPAATAVTVLPGSGRMAKAGNLPIWVRGPRSTRVQTHDRAATARAGVKGLLFTLASEGSVDLTLDYSGFAEAFGGAYGSRVGLVRLPACALTTPERSGCTTPTPVKTKNDLRTGTLSATVSGATVLATAASASSAKGDYTATQLSPSATWQVSTQSGDFGWSYPLRVPPVPGGLTPNLTLSYSSGLIDGRTSNTNNQGSWVGDGFELWPGYIERRYKSCKDDGVPKDATFDVHPGDQCWGYDNATLMLGGRGGELIPAGSGLWKWKNDDGTRIEKITGTDTDTNNGDNNNEYWRVTTPDGTRYLFGKNRLSEWAAGKPETASTWTTPVFGDDGDEPCHQDAFKDSWCQQAWRWNLDYIEDTHGNAVVFTYGKEDNNYGRNLRAEDDTPYNRGGYLKSVNYGLRSGNLFPARAPAQVEFQVSERCLRATESECAASNIDTHPEYWQDVPWDLNCKTDTKCEDTHGTVSPSFWTRKRLTKVITKVITADGAGYRPVDSWSFAHDWGTADVDRQLLLQSITQRGEAADAKVTLPPVTFAYTQKPNRVDVLGDDAGPFIKNRLGAVYNETGGALDVNYSTADCSASNLPTPSTNRTRCFPIYWNNTAGGGGEDPTLDWFHKYVVTQTVQTDLTGGAPDMVTDYDYSIGRPAWHFADDDGLTPEKFKTWSQWRGYDKVRVIGGATAAAPSQTDYWFFQGMDGDRLNADGGSKDVSVADGEGNSYPDHESLQGMGVRTVTYNGRGGPVVSKAVSEPWHHQTASRTRPWGTVTANLTGVRTSRTMTAVGSGWRETKSTTTSFDLTTGAALDSDNAGDTAVTGDESCSTVTMTAAGSRVLPQPAQVRTVGRPCSATPDLSKDLISDTRTYYDGGAFKAAPGAGDVTLVEKAKSATATAVTYLPAVRTKYDTYGREYEVQDVAGRVSKIGYAETQGLTTRVTTTTPPADPADASSVLTTVNDLDTAWGSAVKATDAGTKTVTTSYDALGRVLKVWSPGRADPAVPDSEFVYTVAAGRPVAVAAKDLTDTGGQEVSYTIFDGWLRPRQAQAPGRDGTTKGRLVSDTFYNGSGAVDRTYEPYYADGEPTAVLFGVADPGQIETQHVYEYDGLGRKVKDRLMTGSSDAQEAWHTRYEYGGDWTKVTPPEGGVPVTTYTDALGRTKEIREHRTSGYVGTKFSYDNRGQLEKVTGVGGHVWSYVHDLRGRLTQATDPDSGVRKSTYNDLDQLTVAEDARGKKIGYGYDGIGRRIAKYDQTSGTPGTLLAKWVFDTVRTGQLTSSTRYGANGDAYTTRVDFYDNLNRPTRTRILLPDSEGPALAPPGGYVFDTSYNLDGSVKAVGSPPAGDLPPETMTFTYDDLGRLVAAGSNLSASYVLGSDFTKTGKLIGRRMSTGGPEKQVEQTFTYELGTQRLKVATVAHMGMAGTDRSAEYFYSDAGRIDRVVDTSRDGVDNQCFRYDDLQRLTDAWTDAAAACTADPAAAALGGPAPYRVKYSYDDTGNRLTEDLQSGGPGLQVTTARKYAYAGNTGVDPALFKGHQLAAVTGSATESYRYDASGNTVSRATSAGAQTLTWDAENELTKVADSAKGDTSFLYTADGDRLIRRDRTGTTLYLPGLEVHQAKGTTTATATRFYDFGAMRTAAGVTFLIGDQHGTAELAINAATGALSQRRYLPFGQLRGSRNAWPTGNDKGFVGGTIDSATDLTTLGARSYDPNNGRFISVDPLISMGATQQMNGYNYADNNPVNLSDPDGLSPYPPCYPGCTTPPPGNQCAYISCKNPGGPVNGGYTPPPSTPAPSSPPPAKKRCGWGCHFKNVGNAIVDGAVNHVMEPVKQVVVSVFDAGCWGAAGSGSDTGGFCRPEASNGRRNWASNDIHVDLGGDTNSREYKITKKVTEVALEVGGLLVGIRRPSPGALGRLTFRQMAKKGPRALKKEVRLRSGPNVEPGASGSCPKNSFAPGTDVAMADGSKKPIEKVKVGDKVLATDPATGRTAARSVTHTIIGQGPKTLIHISTADGGTLTATDKHPFWVPDLKRWVNAIDLKAGAWLQTSSGTWTQITALTITGTTTSQRVHNLTVDDIHTYYVLAGNTPVLVHNTGPCGFDPPSIVVDRHGRLTNGSYTLDGPGMEPHVNGTPGKSQFGFHVNSGKAVLDGAAYADANGLWVGNRAKVPVANAVVGYTGDGTPTTWINIYRSNTGFVHGSPGNPP